jgi:hypothetical protein
VSHWLVKEMEQQRSQGQQQQQQLPRKLVFLTNYDGVCNASMKQ